MKSILKQYQEIQEKPFNTIGKQGRIKAGFIDDFDVHIWREKFGVDPIKCIPNVTEIFTKDIPESQNVTVENIDKEDPEKNIKKSKFDIYGVPIIKLDIKEGDVENPITPEMIIAAYKFFKVPEDHFKHLKEIIISDEIPSKKWAFGTYDIKKKGKELLDNHITIWAQKVVMMNNEKRYEIRPSNVPGPMYLTSSRFHYEILGDTIIHELGHHYDLWINEGPIGVNGWVARAETIAEKYARSFTAIKRRSDEFLSIMKKYGEEDNSENDVT